MTHTVLVASKMMARDNDALVRSVYANDNIDNGWVFSASAIAATSGSLGEVFYTTTPVTGSLTGLWMMNEPELPFLASGTNKYNGIGVITDWYVSASSVATANKPMVGDIITLTVDAFNTAPTAGQYALATNGSYKLTVGAASNVGTGFCVRVLNVAYIPFADGTIGSSRLTAYRCEVTYN
jgi:hypothetical protein